MMYCHLKHIHKLHHAVRHQTYTALGRWFSSGVTECDYAIVGAGSAGCVLANRLTADGSSQVHLLEAGIKDSSWKFQMPAALMYTLMDSKVNWCYYTIPQKHVNQRKMYWPRAKVWGGCSSHNAMVYIRGNALDYDRWESEGASGWSYADCLPYFIRSETCEWGKSEYRGDSGPMRVSRGLMDNPLHQAFLEAGVQAGYPATDDCNGFQQEGFGPFDRTISGGSRSNTSRSYLRPALSRSNLKVTSPVLVTKVKFEGQRAVGVEYVQNGVTKQIRAHKEVILSGGSINTPQLLLLSGVGDSKHLKDMEIPVIHHLPGVGQNLQDHLEVYLQQQCTQPITLYKYQWKFPHHMIKTGLQWFMFKTGAASTTHMETGAFIRSRPGVSHPDIQFHFLPSAINNHGQEMVNCQAYQVHVGPMRSNSKGEVKLKSKNPAEHPLIDPNYLSTEEDKVDFRHCIRLGREIFAQKAFDPFRAKEIQPGSDVQSDSEIDAFIRAKSDTAYHPSCTCKMGGASDKLAVVDPHCKVYGLESLRIVDASIMPSVITGNLNGPTVMIAEKASDIILGKDPLPKSKAPVYSPTSLDTQR